MNYLSQKCPHSYKKQLKSKHLTSNRVKQSLLYIFCPLKTKSMGKTN